MTCPTFFYGISINAGLLRQMVLVATMPCSNSNAVPSRPQSLPKPPHSETGFTMNTYVAVIGGKAVLTFCAVHDDQAHAMIDDQEVSVRSDLTVLVNTDGKPLSDGKSAIQVPEATAAQHAEWKRSRDQAIGDGEIDLDAGNNPDEWNVYLMGDPKNKVRRKK